MQIVGKPSKICYRFVVLLISVNLLAGFILCTPEETDVDIRGKRNIFCRLDLTFVLKEAILLILHEIKGYDPLSLDDLPVTLPENGIFRGLSTLTNTKDVVVNCIENDLVTVNTTLSVKNVELTSNWTQNFIFTEIDGTVWMKANEIEFELGILMNTTSNVTLQVTKTLITKLDNFKVGFSGLGPFNPLVSGIINTLYKVWKSEVTAITQHITKKVLDLELPALAHLLGDYMR